MSKKVRKLGYCFVAVLFMFLVGLQSNGMRLSAYAENSEFEEHKGLIENMIFDMAELDGKSIDEIVYSVQDVYVANEEWGGYVIDFVTDTNENGYAIFFKDNDVYKLIELFIGRKSPFYGKQGMFIYPSLGCYYIKIDNVYYNAETMKVDEEYELNEEVLFYAVCNSGNKTNVQESIKYTYNMGFLHQNSIGGFKVGYDTGLTSHANNCANAAGVIALNYWNMETQNDLLNLSSSQMLSDFSMNDATAATYMGIFYDYMNTNWLFGTGGTLPSGVYDGFERLIQEKGYNVTRQTDLTYDQMISSIEQGIPVFITSTDYYFTLINASLPYPQHPRGYYELTIDYEHSWGLENAHTFVGYGYAYYNFYDTTSYITNEEFIKIADGWGDSRYFNVTRSGIYSSAAINVYK